MLAIAREVDGFIIEGHSTSRFAPVDAIASGLGIRNDQFAAQYSLQDKGSGRTADGSHGD